MLANQKRFILPCSILAAVIYISYYLYNVTKPSAKVVFNEHLIKQLTEDRFVPPFVNFVSPYAVAPVHNLSICCISKSMSTMMRGMACALYDTEEFISNNRSILEIYTKRSCVGKNEHSRMHGVELQMGSKVRTKIAVVRNPIDRFISFFSDKCRGGESWRPSDRCYGCRHNMTCFLERQYSRFLEYSSDSTTTLKPSLEDYHTAPFSWNCEFGKYLKEYNIVKMDPKSRTEGVKQLMGILKESHVPESTIKFLEASALGGRTFHTTSGSNVAAELRKEIEESKAIRELLRKIYYLDFLIFGFDTQLIDN